MNLREKTELSRKIIRLAKQGIRPALIAERLGCEPAQVQGLIHYERRKGMDIPTFPRGPVMGGTLRRRLTLGADVMHEIEAEAVKRRMSVTALAERIVSNVADKDLFGAVLDEGGSNV